MKTKPSIFYCLALLFGIFFSMNTDASVVVTAATGGSNLSADKAANATTPAYTILVGKLYIAEGTGSDFAANQSNVTLTLAAPANWAFNPNVGTIARTGHGSFMGNSSIVVTATSITVTFSTTADVAGIDTLIISNVQVQSTNGSLLPNAATIVRSGGTAVMNGFTSNVNCGSLSQVAGTIHHFVFNPDNNSSSNIATPQRTGVAFSISIYAKDQFNNTATTFAGAAALTVNGGTISPANSGNLVAGVKTLNVTLSPAGSGRIITATNVSKTGTSNAITVNADGITPQGSLAGSTICNGSAGQLRWTATYGTNPYSIVYSNGITVSTATGVNSGTPFNVAVNPTSTTTYTLLSITDANGNSRNNGFMAGTAVANVISRPTAVVSGSSVICQGGSTNINVQLNGTAPFSFKINGGNTITSNSNSATVTVSPTITTNYVVTNLNDANCVATSGDMTGLATVTVNIPSVITGVVLNASIGELCNNGNQSTTLTQSGGMLGTSAYWQWYSDAGFTNAVGGHLTSVNAAITVTPTATTTYYLRAEGTASPCNNLNAVTGNVTVIVDQPTMGGSITNATPCSSSGTLNLSGNVGVVQKWQWSSVPTFTTNVHDINNTSTTQAYNVSGIIYYRVLVKNGVCDSAFSSPIVVSPTGVSISINPPNGATPGDTISPCNGLTNGLINFHPSGGTGVYKATLTNGNSSTTVDSPFPSPVFGSLGPGNYVVTVMDTNTHCTFSQNIHLANLDSITFIPEVVNTTCNSNNDGAIIITNFNDTAVSHHAGAIGGSGYYFYSTDGVPHFNYYSPPVINSLTAGSFIVQAKDNYGCLSRIWNVSVGVTDLPPVLSSNPGNITASCDSIPTAVSVTATDQCDSSISVSYTEVRTNGNCANNYMLTRTWSGTDSHNNTTQWIQIVTIRDTTKPQWVTTVGTLDRSVECSDIEGLSAAQSLIPSAHDNCSASLSPIKTSEAFVTMGGSCPQSGTYTNSWIVIDECGNQVSAPFIQTISIYDHTAPAWVTAASSLNRSVECGDSAGLAAARALVPAGIDNCSQTMIAVKVGSCFNSTNGACPQSGTYTNIWTISDGCGNFSTANFIQTITVNDTTPPTWLTANGSLDRTIECNDSTGLNAAESLIPVAHDNCSTNLIPIKTVGSFVPSDYGCPHTGSYTNTWAVSDGCDNNIRSIYTQTITIIDHTAPSWITNSGILDRRISCNDPSALAVAQALDPQAIDNCSQTINLTKTNGSFVSSGGNCPHTGSYTNTWIATDGCNNTNETVFTQTITIIDTIPPSWITPSGSLDRSVGCNDTVGLAAAQALAPTAHDNCSTNIILTKTSGNFISSGGACPQAGTYTNTWNVSDGCGNTSTALFTQTITVYDYTSPVWTTNQGSLDCTIECSNATALSATQSLSPFANDNCSSTLNYYKSSGSFVPGNNNCSQAGTYTNTWTVNDGCGNNVSSVYTQTITLYDHTSPTWTSTSGSLDRSIECSDTANLHTAQALLPTASDNCTNNLTIVKTAGTFVSSGGSCPQSGTYTNTFSVNDGCGNSATSNFTQTITIYDHTPPTWSTQSGSLNRLVACSDSANLVAAQALVPVALDNCSQNIILTKTSGSFVPSGNNAPESGTYTNTWTATDGCGNTATSVFTQTITIDPTGPYSSTICPVYYDRAVRFPATTNNLFLQAIFAWDNLPQNVSSCPNCETNNLLKYLRNNHINKIIIDGLAYHSPNGCGSGPLGIVYGNVYPMQLSNFITNAKTNYGVTTVLAGIHELNEVANGDIRGSKADIDAIVAYNNNANYTGKIDQFWIDYEFWNQGATGYCANCPTTNPCNVHYFTNSSAYIDSHGRAYTEFGFRQFKTLIAYADSQRLNTGTMQKSEVLIIPNLNFNIDESYPPYHIGFNLSNHRYVFDTTGGTLTQSLAFADWLMNPSHNIGAVAIDLTSSDGRSSTNNTVVCNTGNVIDQHSCISKTPDHFLNIEVDNYPDDISPCADPWDPNHFSASSGTYRQRCLDFLGSFGNGSIPICPYFSTESLTFNTLNALSNYMTGDVCANNNPAYGGVCSNSTPHYFPDIDSTFMAQYNNSWKESFVQSYSDAPTVLYTDPIYSNLNFSHQQSPSSPWWGALNSVRIGSVEYFPMNTYPLVLDNVPCHGYNINNHVNAFAATAYPSSAQPPFMYIPQDRSRDGAPDKYIACHSGNRAQQNNTNNNASNLPFSAAFYPNPSDGNFTLSCQLPSGKGDLMISDIIGREVYKLKIIGLTNSMNINLSKLPAGLYFWEIIGSDTSSLKGKLEIVRN